MTTFFLVKWQSPSFVRPTQEPDIELLEHSYLDIGFDISNSGPFQFHLSGDLTEEIGYFKVFVARRSCPHLEMIVQDPLANCNIRDLEVKPRLNPEMARWWATEVVELVQRGT